MDREQCDSSSNTFRAYLPDLCSQRFVAMRSQDAQEYARVFKEQGNPPWLHALWRHWLELFEEPYQGVTNDGKIIDGLFQLEDEEVPIALIVEAAQDFVASLDQDQKQKTLHHIDSPEWRTWSNPEFLLSDKGVRLDEVDQILRDRALRILQRALSPEGYEKARSAMRINAFLGELVEASSICNEYSYNLAIFGTPSTSSPWGFSFYGHHLCLNLFFYKSQVVISPWFTGAEPNIIDTGPFKGTTILRCEERLGRRLMQSLQEHQRQQAQIYQQLCDPAMPSGRWNRDDQRHLCGAYRDNRVVPYEGLLVANMEAEQKSLVTDILAEYLLYLPSRAREIRLAHIKSHFSNTFFCWIGGFSDTDAFYYRIQSPVVVVEFDHHSGVFLNNPKPAPFHTHSLLRTPNTGDYGKALLPLIPRKEQAFVWTDPADEKNEAAGHGYQPK